MTLLLDTRTPHIRFGLHSPKTGWIFFRRRFRQPDAILGVLEHWLRQHRLNPKKLKQILVVTGPGMFSYVRTGVVIAQTLRFVNQTPVVAIQAGDEEMLLSELELTRALKSKPTKKLIPQYGREPSITIST